MSDVGGLYMNADRTDEEVGFNIGYERASYGVCRQDLDAMGERAVRDALNSGKWGHSGLAPFTFVSAWLKDAEFARILEDETKRSAREDKMLRLTSDAADSARLAARWAMLAAIIAITAIAIAIQEKIVPLVISWLP